jgi:hypothetical protein
MRGLITPVLLNTSVLSTGLRHLMQLQFAPGGLQSMHMPVHFEIHVQCFHQENIMHSGFLGQTWQTDMRADTGQKMGAGVELDVL